MAFSVDRERWGRLPDGLVWETAPNEGPPAWATRPCKTSATNKMYGMEDAVTLLQAAEVPTPGDIGDQVRQQNASAGAAIIPHDDNPLTEAEAREAWRLGGTWNPDMMMYSWVEPLQPAVPTAGPLQQAGAAVAAELRRRRRAAVAAETAAAVDAELRRRAAVADSHTAAEELLRRAVAAQQQPHSGSRTFVVGGLDNRRDEVLAMAREHFAEEEHPPSFPATHAAPTVPLRPERLPPPS